MPARKPAKSPAVFGAPMQKGDVTTRMVTALKGMIGEGGLAPGAKLPSERELALRFGVSRPSLRQALKVLEVMGVLSQRVGDGTYLSTNASAILAEPMEFLVLLDGISHLELFESRMIVEPELAARAAGRATAEDISILKKMVAEMEEKPGDRGRQVELDIAFHDEIFRAAGNRVCRQIFNVIHRGILTSISRLSQRARLDAVIAEHKLIYDAISRREPDLARTRMNDHLQKARSLFLTVGI